MNIMLTNRCNGTCQYCFLKGELAQDHGVPKDITLEDFHTILKYAHHLFSLGSIDSLNLMGGEPTLHPKFREILKASLTYKTKKSGFMPVSIFTNGLFPEETGKLLQQEGCRVMVNVNHPLSYPECHWNMLHKNLSILTETIASEPWVTLSLNIDRADQDFEYLLDLCQQYRIKKIRVDISRPEPNKRNTHIKMEDIPGVMPLLVNLAQRCKQMGIEMNTDCCLPICGISNEQLQSLEKSGVELSFKCSGGIDVTPDLEIWHCAPLRSIKFGKITDYPDGVALVKEIARKTAPLRWNVSSKESCKDCKWWTLKICQGGCLSSKKMDGIF
ncbi:MAG: radical SAM protein [Candidatus Brocadiae bacterium]|nr:radical SAM protein [Candidatus Brocadiia bacterium]